MSSAGSSSRTNMRQTVRCAVYTRKSTEEGLDQEFNTLDAQREACAAYIVSQRHEGWTMLPDHYDDGGFSGGNMDRPGLRALLADVESGKIDVIVVYKVDRLTRALSDFARIVDILDTHEASFVSITQAFNTTTSMGRLTLNVLLSFAQFEREVISERVRDKIAASKKKGMWMGGRVPLGYDAIDKKLIVNEAEAETVRHIMELYLKLGNVGDLQLTLRNEGVRTKTLICRNGRVRGGGIFSRGALYHLLKNRIYRGEIEYKNSIYQGEHEAIVAPELWDRVQALLIENRTLRTSGANAKEPSLLAGMIFDASGRKMKPSHATKNNVRYRYYVETANRERSGALRLPAGEIEIAVRQALIAFLEDEAELFARFGEVSAGDTRRLVEAVRDLKTSLPSLGVVQQRKLFQALQLTVRVTVEGVVADMCARELARSLGVEPNLQAEQRWQLPLCLSALGTKDQQVVVSARAGNRSPDMRLVALIVKAELARRHLFEGRAAEQLGFSDKHIARLARLGFLAPDIVAAIMDGQQPVRLTARQLLRAAEVPMDWGDQRVLFSFS